MPEAAENVNKLPLKILLKMSKYFRQKAFKGFVFEEGELLFYIIIYQIQNIKVFEVENIYLEHSLKSRRNHLICEKEKNQRKLKIDLKNKLEIRN